MSKSDTVKTFGTRSALAFIVSFGIVSLFADMAYEGMRGISGPYLALLGASGAAVGIIAGTGELAGYLLRLGSARIVERTRAYWLIALLGYVVQMAAVPLLALAGNWWMAAVLIVFERAGKALRNPAANTMMSRAGEHIGQGWAFGLHEALDQTGAMVGPLIAALVLAEHHQYREALLWLGVPAALTILCVLVTAVRFPYAGHVKPTHVPGVARGLSHAFWLYTASASLFAFGFADYSLAAYHFAKADIVGAPVIPILYAAAMGSAGAGSLLFGRWFDRRGLAVLFPGIVLAACAPPLMFLGGTAVAIAGTVLWGVALGVQDAIMSAAIARLVPEQLRARAYGVFPAVYGVAWFLGSALLGELYDHSLVAVAAVAAGAQLLALYPLRLAMRRQNASQ
ncbi:MAG: MFS transporter [Alphaproteobacteria bacterium]|nr:MFS transporter [Alphaproteobacteria bacterium]